MDALIALPFHNFVVLILCANKINFLQELHTFETGSMSFQYDYLFFFKEQHSRIFLVFPDNWTFLCCALF